MDCVLVKASAGRLPNIGSFEIGQGTRDNISDLFQALTIPWWYVPEAEHYETMLKLFKKYYDKKECDLFVAAYDFQLRNFDQTAAIRNAGVQLYSKGFAWKKMAKRIWRYVPFKHFFRGVLAALGLCGK